MEINVGMSMIATHYFENGIKKGEIFYKWPGAVMYLPCQRNQTRNLVPNDLTCDKKGSYYFRCRLLGDSIVVGAVVTAVTDGVAAGPV